MVRSINCFFIYAVMVFAGCNRTVVENSAGDIPVITPVNRAALNQTTDDDVTWRRYEFATMPLQFFFSDSTASYVAYGNSYHKNIRDIFYSKQMAEKAGKLLRNYDLDFEYTTNEPAQYQLTESWTIEFGKRSYILSVFDKRQFSVGPLNPYFYCLIDTTDPDAVSAVGFINRLPEDGDMVGNIFGKDGHLCIAMQYYTKKKGYRTGTAIITQNQNNEWVIQ